MKKLLSVALTILMLVGLLGVAASALSPSHAPRLRPSPSGLIWPVPGFGRVANAFWRHGGRVHPGIDIVGHAGHSITGTGVVAVRDGVVESVEWIRTFCRSVFGYEVLIDHGDVNGFNLSTRYVHLMAGSVRVERGQHVVMGEPIGRAGNAGRTRAPHLHFQVLINGRPQNPLNFVSPANGAHDPPIR